MLPTFIAQSFINKGLEQLATFFALAKNDTTL
jgi:hypothetical protein